MIRLISPLWFFIRGRNFEVMSLFSLGSMMWVGVGSVGAGLIGSLYGANKQSKDNAANNAANKAAIAETDLNAWKGYLMQRGVNPAGVTTFGQVPVNPQPVNTKLPLWAVRTTQPSTPQPLPGQGTTSLVRRRAA